MGLRIIRSHRLTVLIAASCAIIGMIGCGGDESNLTAEVPAAADDKTGTQYVSSSQSSRDIDFDDLSGNGQNRAQGVGASDNASSSLRSGLTVLGERNRLVKFSNGAPQKRYRIRLMSDKSIVRHGPYIEYYPNGNQFKRGHYTNGLQDGQWVYWYANGKIAKHGKYKLGEHDGRWVYRSKEGLKRREENYVAGKRHGIWLYYQKDAERLLRQVEWKGDVRDGRSIEYYPSGQRKISTEWKNNKLDGRVLRWYPEGQKLSYEEYQNGERNGRAVMWSKSGTVQADLVYRDDRRVSGG